MIVHKPDTLLANILIYLIQALPILLLDITILGVILLPKKKKVSKITDQRSRDLKGESVGFLGGCYSSLLPQRIFYQFQRMVLKSDGLNGTDIVGKEN
ncbi:hypothetical protein SDC9_60694 [bioreactor metagenome]|uniref:Uncharacterized protein n=1 Tax=bioreactor metagenome TaxID=1076179 RepID=A0A644XDR6_9ZZZZ